MENSKKPSNSLAKQILIALVAGTLFGYLFPTYGLMLKPVGDMFIRMIKMIVVPLIMSSLIIGIAGTGDFRKIGRLGVKSAIWFEVATTLALIIGIVVVNWLQPGSGVQVNGIDTGTVKVAAGKTIDLMQMVVNIIPTNIFDAMARGDLLQIVVFATFFGVATSAVGPKGEVIVHFAHGVAEIMFKFTWYVMKLAPIGVFALLAYTIGKYGLNMLVPLAKLIGSFYIALAVFVSLVLASALVVAGVSISRFIRVLKEPILLAFTTTSSEAALPSAMEKLEKLGVPKHVISFVLPTGYVFNLDGATLYSALAVVFVAQVYGVPFDLSQQVIMMLALMISTKGLAAVPGAVLIVIAGAASSFGLPAEGIALLLGIDRILDMGRTTVNLVGNCVAAIVVAAWEKELDGSVFANHTTSS